MPAAESGLYTSARLSRPVLLAAGVFMALVGPEVSMAPASEFPISARQCRQVLLGAVVCTGLAGPQESTSAGLSRPALLAVVFMGLAGPQESTSARLSPQVLPAWGPSMPAAGWELHTSARLSRPVLLAAGFMALEWAELSRAAARRSDRAASDIAERRMFIRTRRHGAPPRDGREVHLTRPLGVATLAGQAFWLFDPRSRRPSAQISRPPLGSVSP